MTDFKLAKPYTVEEAVQRVIRTVCYVSLPLILLFFLTIGISLAVTGGVNTNINTTTDFGTVFLSFSLPMLTALAAVPLLVKMMGQKCGAAQLGLCLPRQWLNVAFCAATAAGAILLTFRLAGTEGLELAPWTVCIHFLCVAVAEEVMLRSILMDELQGLVSNRWLLALLNGVIFAFVYHSNEGFLPNLLVRVPLGFVLSMVRLKSNSVYPAIGLHWFYNMLVTTL